MDYCKFHPNKVAHVRCKTCHIPLCEECRVSSEIGVFCSEECFQKAKDFQETVRPVIPKQKEPSAFWLIVKVALLILLVVAIALGLDLMGFVTLPFVEQIKELIGLA